MVRAGGINAMLVADHLPELQGTRALAESRRPVRSKAAPPRMGAAGPSPHSTPPPSPKCPGDGSLGPRTVRPHRPHPPALRPGPEYAGNQEAVRVPPLPPSSPADRTAGGRPRKTLAAYLGANLVAALPSLQVHDLPHGGGDCGATAEEEQVGRSRRTECYNRRSTSTYIPLIARLRQPRIGLPERGQEAPLFDWLFFHQSSGLGPAFPAIYTLYWSVLTRVLPITIPALAPQCLTHWVFQMIDLQSHWLPHGSTPKA